jgi:hypothetical protein
MFSANTTQVSTAANYIEDVFSTWLYTGTSATQSIINGINFNTNGGLLWIKDRSRVANHKLVDTARGAGSTLASNLPINNTGESTLPTWLNNGFTLPGFVLANESPITYASWSFRKQPKFFDVVTYTGTGANRTIAHNLGSVPGSIFVKRTDAAADWQVYHRSLANTQYMVLNSTAAVATGATRWNSTTPTSTVFSVGTDTTVNASGGTYVAYIFAHDAGGFGNAGTDNVISCGGVTTNASGLSVTLGWEPQFVMLKPSSSTGAWYMFDNLRPFSVNNGGDAHLESNSTNIENFSGDCFPNATGFTSGSFGTTGQQLIYIAIRRGPMKTPTVGTSVFGLNARTGTGAIATVTGGQTDDAVLIKNRGAAVASLLSSRLTGTGYLATSGSLAESEAGTTILQANPWDVMDGVKVGTTSTITNASANTFINYLFRRAPGFFDVVCYKGTGAVLIVNHNLGVVPQLIIAADRSLGQNKPVYSSSLLNTEYLVLNSNVAKSSAQNVWNSTTPTTTTFTLSSSSSLVNNADDDNIAYLFATVAGVSKVGSYTGTAALLTVNCGFTSGARFVLIKRTDSTGDWYVWDSARGITAGNDPYLLLNSTAAEVTGTNYVDTDATGFKVTAAAPAALNASGGTYIFLAIA